MRIGLIGALGFVGSALSHEFSQVKNISCVPIIRGANFANLAKGVDFFIHAANPAKRFSANLHPERDRLETVEKTNDILAGIDGKPILLISSISCRTQLKTPYGINRLDCEKEVLKYGGTVVRLGPMFGPSRVNDVLHDICAGRDVFVSRDTKYSYSSVMWNAAYIAGNFQSINGVIEIGARNTVLLEELAQYTNSLSKFSEENDDQFPESFIDGPDVSEVFRFIDKNIIGR